MTTSTQIATTQEGELLFVDYPKNQKEAVLRAAEAWQLFCSLLNETKQAFTYEPAAKSSAGFELKVESGSNQDRKENFHYTIEQAPRLAKIGHVAKDLVANQFLYSSGELILMLHPLVMEFAQMLESKYSIAGLVEEVLAAKTVGPFAFCTTLAIVRLVKPLLPRTRTNVASRSI